MDIVNPYTAAECLDVEVAIIAHLFKIQMVGDIGYPAPQRAGLELVDRVCHGVKSTNTLCEISGMDIEQQRVLQKNVDCDLGHRNWYFSGIPPKTKEVAESQSPGSQSELGIECNMGVQWNVARICGRKEIETL